MIGRLVRVTGRVQRVGFRWSTIAAAERIGVVGWVRNRSDGSVEALVQGHQQQVESMVAWLGTGPPSAHVAGVEIVEVAVDPGVGAFTVRQ